ncbi:MAG: acetolactate synthase large subunit [Alphaproteobacteria bacterium]|nr:acetolactate synthase large subunit [Alphaproteobacteria bacterium]
MNGAESLTRSLVNQGVTVCFANPGTSEMHFVAALDQVQGMRCVLGLFEGVVTAAADGYYRMADKPACTLLHLGPGLGNGLANLHNAKKAGSGIINIVGEHATYHIEHNAPLTSDIEGVARPMSHWVQTCNDSTQIASAGADAVEAARQPPGQIATLVLPADTAWNPGGAIPERRPTPQRASVPGNAVDEVARALRSGRKTALLLGGAAGRETALMWAGRIAAASGADVLCEYSLARLERGAGRVTPKRVPYSVDLAVKMLAAYEQIVLIGSRPPVAFFAYPGKPSLLAAPGCEFVRLAEAHEDIDGALEALVDALGARQTQPLQLATLSRPPPPGPGRDPIEPIGLGQLIAALIPEGAVVVDESVSSGRGFDQPTGQSAPHSWLNIMGGAIGHGLPGAVGAAIGAPDRPVIVLEGDGSGMYTLQALWSMARESLNVKVVIMANRSYNILQGELKNVGVLAPGVNARAMLTLDTPALDWVHLARGMGVPGHRVESLQELAQAMQNALRTPGPVLIEAIM